MQFVVARFRAETASAGSAAAPRSTPVQQLRGRITSLRFENEQLRLHVELYEEHIRRLTIENTRLTAELARHEGVTDLASHRERRTPA